MSVSAAEVYPSGDVTLDFRYALYLDSGADSFNDSVTAQFDSNGILSASSTLSSKSELIQFLGFTLDSSMWDSGTCGILSLSVSVVFVPTRYSIKSSTFDEDSSCCIIVQTSSDSIEYPVSSLVSDASEFSIVYTFTDIDIPDDWISITLDCSPYLDCFSTGSGNSCSVSVEASIDSPGSDEDTPFSANWDYYYYYDVRGAENPAVYHVSGDSLPALVNPDEWDNSYRYWTDGIFLYGLEAGYYYTLTFDAPSGGAIGEVIAYQNGSMYDNVTLRKESMSSKYEITFECLNGGTAENRIGFTLLDYWYVQSGYEYTIGQQSLYVTISLTQGEYTGNTASSSGGSGAVVVKPTGSTGGGSEKSDSSSSTGSNANNNNAAVTWQEWHYTYDDEGNIVSAELVWKINLGDYNNYTQTTLNTLFMSAMCYYSWAWSVDDDGNITYYSGAETDSWLDQMWRLSVRSTLAVEGIYQYIDGLEGSLDGLSSTLTALKDRVTKSLDREDEYIDAASDYTDAYKTARDNASSSASSVNDISSSFSELTDSGVDTSSLFDAFADDEPWLWFSDAVLEDLSPGSSNSISTFSSSNEPEIIDYYSAKMDELESLISKSGE